MKSWLELQHRHDAILDFIQQSGEARTSEIAMHVQMLDIELRTILRRMAAKGLIQRQIKIEKIGVFGCLRKMARVAYWSLA